MPGSGGAIALGYRGLVAWVGNLGWTSGACLVGVSWRWCSASDVGVVGSGTRRGRKRRVSAVADIFLSCRRHETTC